MQKSLQHIFGKTTTKNNNNEFSKILKSVTILIKYYDSIAYTALFAYYCKLSVNASKVEHVSMFNVLQNKSSLFCYFT